MNIHLIAIPYDSGHCSERMGRGPDHFLARGVETALRAAGHAAACEVLSARTAFLTEIATAFDLHRQTAERVRAARERGDFPIVMAGNCGLASLGTLAGIGGAPTGAIWFDAHGDFNTPETTRSGFLDGMALAIAAGRCWKRLAATIPGFVPVSEADVIHVGGRDLDDEEGALMDASEMAVVAPGDIRGLGVREALTPALDMLTAQVSQVYLHVDMDALDPAEAPANHYAPPGGLSVAEMLDAIAVIAERVPIAAAGVASYDPASDPDDRALNAGLRIMERIAAV